MKIVKYLCICPINFPTFENLNFFEKISIRTKNLKYMHKNFENFLEYAQKILKHLMKIANNFELVPENFQTFKKHLPKDF